MLYTPPPIDPKAPPVRINLLSDTPDDILAAARQRVAQRRHG